MIARSHDKTESKALGLAIIADCGFAAYSLAIKQAGAGLELWIEVHSRIAALGVTAATTVFGRKLSDFHRGAALWAAVAGLLDASGALR